MKRLYSAKFFIFITVLLVSFIILGNGLKLSAQSSDFQQLNAQQLLSEMGTGWNLGNQLEAVNNGTPGETNWGNPVITKALITRVKQAGFNTIRIPVSYFSKIGRAPNYTIDSAWLDRIQEVVDYAYDQDMFVIINMHGDGYTTISGSWLLVASSDQATIRDKYQKVWQQIASRFADYDERMIFESMNEEFNGTWDTPDRTYYSNLNAYNQIFVNTVRQTGANNAARWLLIPGWNTNIEYTVGNYGFQMPSDNYRAASIPRSERRIIMSVHYYDPWDFSGEESGAITQWGPEAIDQYRVSSWGQEDYMDSEIKKMYDRFVTQGYPFIIGEYGSVDKISADSVNPVCRRSYAQHLVAIAKKYGGMTVYWDNGYNGAYGFGLFNRNNDTVTQQAIIDGIMAGLGSPPLPTPTPTSMSTPTPTPTFVYFTPTPTPYTNTPTPTPTISSSGNIVVSYDIQTDWGVGATINVTITNNTSSSINGWTLAFSFPGNQTVAQLWNGDYSQSSSSVSVSNAAWNSNISSNGGVVSFGFNLSYSGSNYEPASFTLNGIACQIE